MHSRVPFKRQANPCMQPTSLSLGMYRRALQSIVLVYEGFEQEPLGR